MGPVGLDVLRSSLLPGSLPFGEGDGGRAWTGDVMVAMG